MIIQWVRMIIQWSLGDWNDHCEKTIFRKTGFHKNHPGFLTKWSFSDHWVIEMIIVRKPPLEKPVFIKTTLVFSLNDHSVITEWSGMIIVRKPPSEKPVFIKTTLVSYYENRFFQFSSIEKPVFCFRQWSLTRKSEKPVFQVVFTVKTGFYVVFMGGFWHASTAPPCQIATLAAWGAHWCPARCVVARKLSSGCWNGWNGSTQQVGRL